MKTVEFYEDKPMIGTFLIAQGLDREHDAIRKLISKYKEKFEHFSDLKLRKVRSTGGRAANEILLNEDQFMFLGSLLKNTEKIVDFKFGIIKQFKVCRDQLATLQKYQQQPEYQITRDAGKIVRRQTTDIIQQFVDYATEQGSRNSKMYYTNITRMLNGLLFIVEGKYKNLRNVMNVQQLMTVSSAERIIDRGLAEGMSQRTFYKDIYKDIKKRVGLFAELHGKTEVMERHMELEIGDKIWGDEMNSLFLTEKKSCLATGLPSWE